MKTAISISVTAVIIITAVFMFAACGDDDSIEGKWIPATGQTGGFESVTFDGNNISIPGITAMTAMGVNYTYSISNDELIVSTSGGGVSMEALRLSFKRDGDSIFISDVEYVRE